jgi:hypothetical protein
LDCHPETESGKAYLRLENHVYKVLKDSKSAVATDAQPAVSAIANAVEAV